MDQRLSLITLGVRDVSRARAFYERRGWRESPTSLEDPPDLNGMPTVEYGSSSESTPGADRRRNESRRAKSALGRTGRPLSRVGRLGGSGSLSRLARDRTGGSPARVPHRSRGRPGPGGEQ